MAWTTFEAGRSAEHKATLAAALASYLLGVVGAGAVAAAAGVAFTDGYQARSLNELAAGLMVAAGGALGGGRMDRARSARHRGLLATAGAGAVLLAWIEVRLAVQAGTMLVVISRGVLVIGALAALAAVVGVGIGLRRLARTVPGPAIEFPDSEEQLIALVQRARAEGLTVRVHGSDHSVIGAVASPDDARCLRLSLARLNRIVEWDDSTRRVRVQAGCVLGVDPMRASSTRENSLLHQLDRRGWGLPLLGGVTYQTVAGFMLTGSSGGSVKHSLADAIVGIRLIDGTGAVHNWSPNPQDPQDEEHNPFFAAGVSLGLLGIVTEITLQCEDRFDVGGEEATAAVADAPIQLASPGAGGLADWMRRAEYARVMWWPQPGVERIQTWQAGRLRPEDVPGRARPYVQVPGGRPVQAFLGLYFHWANASTRRSERRVRWMARITRVFVALRVVRFHDSSLRTLPMDNEIDNDLLPVAFTELWIDLDRAHEVGAALSVFYAEDAGWARAGSFACELYAGKRSRFWLSPGYGRDSIRVDLMHIEQGAIRPESEYFPQFWSLLAPFDARFHWGKLMPPPGRLAGRDYFRRVYPRWEDFVALRSRLDPQRLFINDYWRAYLD